MGITLLDNVILAPDRNFASLKRLGYVKSLKEPREPRNDSC